MPAAETPKITKRKGKGGVEETADRFFGAVAARDLDAMAACWHPGGIDRMGGHQELEVPAGMRAFFGEVFGAFPDFELIVLQRIAAGDRCTVHWRATGTFAGAAFQGVEPTGARVRIEGLDLLTIEDGLISRNEAFFDGAEMARQLGVLPAVGSAQEQRMNALVNRSDAPVLYLEVGSRDADDQVHYPDDDLAARKVDGRWAFFHKDGQPY